METKKILGLIFSLIFLGAFAFVLSWGIINFNKVKEGMSGTQIYTNEDLQKSYQDGYDTALKNKDEYDELINGYRDTITALNDNISQLNSQVNTLTNNNRDYANQISSLTEQKTNLQTQVSNLNTIKANNEETISSLNTQIVNLQSQVATLQNSGENKSEQIAQLNNQILNLQSLVNQLQTTNSMNIDTITSLNIQIANLNNQISEMTLLSQNSTSQIANLNNKIAELQSSVTYYESYIAQLENGEQVVATFEYDGSVYNIQIVNKGSRLSVATPTSTDYKIFNGWKVNGTMIDLDTYTITQNTKIVADVTYKYDVIFKVDDEVYDSQVIVKYGIIQMPFNPAKTGYEFDGWSLNGVDVINVQTNVITENTIYQAVFTKLHNVTFQYEDEIKSTQIVRNGNYATAPTIEDTNYKVFNGWKVKGTIVDLSTYKIANDTIFVADIIYKNKVEFKVDNEVYNTQYVVVNSCATIPTAPTKSSYEFDGWSLNGTDIVSGIESILVTEDTTYQAIFTRLYIVTFKQDAVTVSTQAIRNRNYATAPTIQVPNNYKFNGWKVNDSIVDLSSYRIVDDTTFIADISLKEFQDYSWQEISVVSEDIKTNNLSSSQVKTKYGWNIGDEKTFTMTTDEQVTVVILGFNHDNLTGGGKAGISLGMKDCLSTFYKMNSANTNVGGWNSSTMRTETMATLLSLLPSDLKSLIKAVDKKTSAGNTSTTISTTSDKLWLFSEVEISGTTSATYKDEGTQYEYWRTVKDGTVWNDRKKMSNGSSVDYWLRSPIIDYNTGFRSVYASGMINFYGGVGAHGVSFGFCI